MWRLCSAGALALAALIPGTVATGCTMYLYKHENQVGGHHLHADVRQAVGPVTGHPTHLDQATRGDVSSLKLSGPPGCTGRFYCTGSEGLCLTNTHFGGIEVAPYSFEWTIGTDGADIDVTLKFAQSNLPVVRVDNNKDTLLQDPLNARVDVSMPAPMPPPVPAPSPTDPSPGGLLQGGLDSWGECPVGFQITTLAPTLAPSKSPTQPPTASPTEHPTASPTGSPLNPVPPVSTTAFPQNFITSQFFNSSENSTGLCRCDTFGPDTQPFLDRDDSYCGNKQGLLSHWTGAVHFTCPHCVESGASINITCPNHWETCELLLNLYVCPGCSSSSGQSTTGNWPASLAGDGWAAAGQCTASFCSSEGQHPFVGFHKQIMGGDTEMIPETMTDPTMYFSILVKEGVVCESITDSTACEAAALCHYSTDTSSCVLDWCPGLGGPAASPGCGPCAPGTPSGTCQAPVA